MAGDLFYRNFPKVAIANVFMKVVFFFLVLASYVEKVYVNIKTYRNAHVPGKVPRISFIFLHAHGHDYLRKYIVQF